MLIRSISGVRGFTETHLTAESSVVYARALHQLLPKGVIMAGRDGRPSGEDIIQAEGKKQGQNKDDNELYDPESSLKECL